MNEEKEFLTEAEESVPAAEAEEEISSDEKEANICSLADAAEAAEKIRAEAEREIAALRLALAAAENAAARREAEVICGRLLRERHLDEALTDVILPPGADAPDEEALASRADAIARAVREAAVEELRRRAVGIRPGSGAEAPLTGAMIRELPLAKLAELRGK